MSLNSRSEIWKRSLLREYVPHVEVILTSNLQIGIMTSSGSLLVLIAHVQCKTMNIVFRKGFLNSLSANPTKWLNILKQFDDFVGLVLKW